MRLSSARCPLFFPVPPIPGCHPQNQSGYRFADPDTKQRVQDIFLKNGHVQDADRIFAETAFFCFQPVPVDHPGTSRTDASDSGEKAASDFSTRKSFVEFFQETGAGQSVQIFHYPVIIHDAQFIGGKERGEKIFRFCRSFVTQCMFYFCSGSCPVMAVGDIGKRNFVFKYAGDCLNGFRCIHHPDHVADPVFRNKIVNGLHGLASSR